MDLVIRIGKKTSRWRCCYDDVAPPVVGTIPAVTLAQQTGHFDDCWAAHWTHTEQWRHAGMNSDTPLSLHKAHCDANGVLPFANNCKQIQQHERTSEAKLTRSPPIGGARRNVHP